MTRRATYLLEMVISNNLRLLTNTKGVSVGACVHVAAMNRTDR